MKACTLFQNTHMAKWHRHTLSRFFFAKGSGVKNTTIKMIFIVEKLQFLASAKSHFLFFSGGLALINASTGLENELPEMMPVSRQGFLMNLQSVLVGLTERATKICWHLKHYCALVLLHMVKPHTCGYIRWESNGGERFLAWTQSALDHRHHPHRLG